MRLTLSKALLSLLLLSGGLLEEFSNTSSVLVGARKPSRPSSSSRRGPPPTSRKGSSSRSKRGPAPISKRRIEYDEEEDDYDDDFSNDDLLGTMDEEEYEEEEAPIKRSKSKPSPKSKSKHRYEEYDDEEEEFDSYDEEASYDSCRPPSRSSRGSSRQSKNSRARPSSRRPSSRRSSRGRVVSYKPQRRPRESTFTRGLTAFTKSLPDPKIIQSNTLSAISAAREQTSKLSKGIYREVKGLTSSELEQVMLKATKPDDAPVKGKHVERLVGVTYQISGRYDIYDAVLRKLWTKMTEPDWRTKIKALYVLHRFSSDGAPDHQLALKARLRELRRSKDPKKKNVKYFSSKLLLHFDGSYATAENAPYRAFLARYAHYVLLRVQAFGGIFADITLENESSSSKSSSPKKQKPITSTGLRQEHLDGAIMLLKAGCAASLKENESTDHTAVAMERVAADMIGLTKAVASTLTKTLKSDMSKVDQALVQKWCVFYKEELLPKTKVLVKRTSSKLDKFGLFLPSRMGASVPSELLEKGLLLGTEEKVEELKEDEPVESDSKGVDEEVGEKEDATKDDDVEEEEEDEVEPEEEDDDDDDEEEPVKVKQPVNDIDDEYDEYEDEYYDEE